VVKAIKWVAAIPTVAVETLMALRRVSSHRIMVGGMLRLHLPWMMTSRSDVVRYGLNKKTADTRRFFMKGRWLFHRGTDVQ
jgi:hypothetical protein